MSNNRSPWIFSELNLIFAGDRDMKVSRDARPLNAMMQPPHVYACPGRQAVLGAAQT